jgi:hypothetical protein
MTTEKKFKFQKTGEKTFKNNKRVNFQITSADGKFLKPTDIRYLIEQYEKKYPKSQFLVSGVGVSGVHELGDSTKFKTTTFKKFSTSLTFQDEEEYLEGRVADNSKFLQYFQINLSIVKPN